MVRHGEAVYSNCVVKCCEVKSRFGIVRWCWVMLGIVTVKLSLTWCCSVGVMFSIGKV